jgi:hypothetical protein
MSHNYMHRPEAEFDAVVQLSGGFGNQLFQYAFGRQLTAQGLRVGYDIEFYRQPNSVAHNRLRLPEYGFEVPIKARRHRGYETARRLKRLPRRLQQAVFGMAYVKCPATRYVPIGPVKALTYFTGLWQSGKYFETVDDEVRRFFRDRLLAAANRAGGSREGVVGFHVRRGDYLAHKQSENLDYVAYLRAALDQLAEATGQTDWLVSVYSDDPDWCAANLQAPRIEINRGGEMLDDFLGLMQCEHKIISNSTFAWWAAFLGETDGGIVLAPARWHARADSRAAAIVRDGWVVVEG